jgi:acetolactate synthase-1/3 small subunit
MKMGERMIVSILVANQPGALIRTINVFSRRGINIASLNVDVTDDPAISRILLVTESGLNEMDQIKKMLEKIYDVREVEMMKTAAGLKKKSMLATSGGKGTKEGVLDELKAGSILVEITGESKKLNAFIDFMKPYGMIEMYMANKRLN